VAIPGQVSSPFDPPAGCAFAPRCAERQAGCDAHMPPLVTLGDRRSVRCIRVHSNEAREVTA
jgi:oligopeptide/dipeptide ABC transporter ATP-binding protein